MNLSQYLKDHEIAQVKFAKKIGITPVTFNKIVKGLTMPKLDTALKIENESYGKVTCDDLLKAYSENEDKKKQARHSDKIQKKRKLRKIKQ